MRSSRTIIAFICALILACTTALDSSPLSISSIEPTVDFSIQFRSSAHRRDLQGDIFSSLRLARERKLFHEKIMADDTISVLSSSMAAPAAVFGDELHLRFSAFDEVVDLDLQVDRHSVDPRTRVIAGVPGDETVFRPQLVSYSGTGVDAQGAEVRAAVTVMPNKQVRGLLVRGGEIYQVAPMAHLEADLALNRNLRTDPRLAALRDRAAASADMVIYKLSDLRMTDAAGQPQVFCGAVDPDTGLSHVDPLSAPAPAAAPVPAPTSSGAARQPLLKRWTDCHPKAAGSGIKMFVDYMVDVGAALHYSGSSTTVSASTVWSRMAEVVTSSNVFYTGQLATTLAFNTLTLRTGSTSEKWNQWAYDDSRKSSNTLNQDAYLAAALDYRKAMSAADKGATMQFVTRSYGSGVVGQAYIGVIRSTTHSIGFSSIYSDSGFISTVSHELGHNFQATHTFSTCVGEYDTNKGGIMDYSNGVLGSKSDSPGEVGFHSVCSKREMCPHIAARYAQADSSYYVPFAQSFADIDGEAPAKWTCAAAGASSATQASASSCTSSDTTTGYGSCSISGGGCGTGSQTRSVACVSEGKVVSDSNCSGTRPATSKTCSVDCVGWRCAATGTSESAFSNAVDCSTTSNTEAGWGACTVDCSSATQTRAAKCWSSTSGAVVADSSCGSSTKPSTSRSCTAATTISGITVSPASPTAGQTVSVSWSCYYGASQQVQVAIEGGAVLGSAASSAKTVSGTLPVSGAKTVKFTLTADDGTTFTSASVSVKSRCDSDPCGEGGSCTAATGQCACDTGYSGDTCSVSACDKCEANQSTCTPSEGVCHCNDGWSGDTCATSEACDNTGCLNGGYRAKNTWGCSSDCTCLGNWQDDTCSTCSLSCGDHGAHDSGCTECVCDRGYGGDECGCRGAYGVLTFSSLGASTATFSDAVADDIATVSGGSLSQIKVLDIQITSKGVRVIIMLSVCGLSSFAPAADGFTSMEDVYAGWAAVEAATAPGAYMTRGSSAALAGEVSADAMYDPLCTGPACPAGSDPYAADSSSDDNTTYIIVGTVVGAFALAAAGYLVYRCTRSDKPDEQDATETAARPAAMELATVGAAPIAVCAAQAPASPSQRPHPPVAPRPDIAKYHNAAPKAPAAPQPPAAPPAALPAGWRECLTDDGQHRYYWHAETQQASWNRPTAA